MLKGMGRGGTFCLLDFVLKCQNSGLCFWKLSHPAKNCPSPRDLETNRTQRHSWQLGFLVLPVVGEGFPGKLGGINLAKSSIQTSCDRSNLRKKT